MHTYMIIFVSILINNNWCVVVITGDKQLVVLTCTCLDLHAPPPFPLNQISSNSLNYHAPSILLMSCFIPPPNYACTISSTIPTPACTCPAPFLTPSPSSVVSVADWSFVREIMSAPSLGLDHTVSPVCAL